MRSKSIGSVLVAPSVVLVAILAAGSACAEPANPLGLHTTDASGCRLSDGRGVEAPTIVLMAGAYDKLPPNAAVALKVIDVAIKAGCDIDEPDELGFRPAWALWQALWRTGCLGAFIGSRATSSSSRASKIRFGLQSCPGVLSESHSRGPVPLVPARSFGFASLQRCSERQPQPMQ